MEVRRADAAFQRLVLLVLVAGACAGALLVGAIDRYREALADWVRADAGRLAQRIELVFAVFAAALVTPLVGMAAYLSSLGRRTVRTGEFPPLGFRVIRDTPVVRGAAAHSRGRTLQGVAVLLSGGAMLIGLLLWRLASLFAAGIR
jgi:hypothetical protein